jgi:chlorobactene glucosyltransferase
MQIIAAALVELYYPVIVFLALYFFILALSNIVEMHTHTVPPEITEGPMVSVLIPVRNEEDHIENCLESLCNQDYQNYEILVIDDNSTDKTMAILNRIARNRKRVRVYSGASLPEDWYGKPFALQQLSGKARGDIFMFTDADTIHNPSSVSWAVTNMTRSKADFVSGYVGQILQTFGEKITVPLMFFLTGFIIPLGINKLTRFGFFASAVGQFIVIKKEVFEQVGGFNAVKKKTSEDVYLARHVKTQGYHTMFLDLSDQVRCRMYTGYRKAVEGIGKNIFDFLGKNSLLLFIIFFVILFFLLLPFPLFWFEAAAHGSHAANLLAVNILYSLTWMILFLDRKITWYYALLWPLMFLNLLYMAGWSWFKTLSGQGFIWKGRIVT